MEDTVHSVIIRIDRPGASRKDIDTDANFDAIEAAIARMSPIDRCVDIELAISTVSYREPRLEATAYNQRGFAVELEGLTEAVTKVYGGQS